MFNISRGESGGRVSFLPLGSPIIPVKSPIQKLDLMSEILELAQLVDHTVARDADRARWDPSELHFQRSPDRSFSRSSASTINRRSPAS